MINIRKRHLNSLNWVLKKNIINESQYTYRSNGSTKQAIVNITEEIYNKSIDKGEATFLVLHDLCKTSDSVNHEW